MPQTIINTSLPECVIEDLRRSGAVVRDACSIIIIEALEKSQWDVLSNFLQSKQEVDPILTPNFGPPLVQFVPPNVQVEVYQLLSTYQTLLTANAPLPALSPLLFPVGGGVQYHHAQIAIQKVMEQIEDTNPAFGLPGLAMVLQGQVICDLTITYANCQIVRRIRKF